MYALIRKLLFLLPPEIAHLFVMTGFRIFYAIPLVRIQLRRLWVPEDPRLVRKLFGLTFPNPVGLAAGFDKDGKFTNTLEGLGFGFLEVGTVTPLPQTGNPKPRLFRLLRDHALINRMGFNNEGVTAMAERLKRRTCRIPVGGNIGRNRDTTNLEAVRDYEICFRALYSLVDYFVVNVSSPNTPGLRKLQEGKWLENLLGRLQQLNTELGTPRPVLVKIAPDLTETQLDEIIRVVRRTGISGIVATNTTLTRKGLRTDPEKLTRIGTGGLSGKPLKDRSTKVIRYIHNHSGGSIPIIASGGIFTADDAAEKFAAGASLVQLYTGFIYEGPGLVKRICRDLISPGTGTQ